MIAMHPLSCQGCPLKIYWLHLNCKLTWPIESKINYDNIKVIDYECVKVEGIKFDRPMGESLKQHLSF